MTSEVDTWLTVEAAAQLLGVDADEIEELIANSELAVVDLGEIEGVRIRMSDFSKIAMDRLKTSNAS